MKIEDYGFLSDTETGALVGFDGSIDWLCVPRFDSGACFAALLGGPENGRWRIWARGRERAERRRYQPGTLVLETEFETEEGCARIIDFMPPRGHNPDIVRIVEGVLGRVSMKMELVIRFDYGSIVPWVRKREDALAAIAGPDMLVLRTPVSTEGKNLTTTAEFEVREGDRIPFVLTWAASNLDLPKAVDPEQALRETKEFWEEWSGRCRPQHEWAEEVTRSLITLKGLTYGPTGGIVAALTTSLPEEIGGVRNWDYRYCWLRDATFTLYALLDAGYTEEAKAWRDWLLRAIAGTPAQMQIMYGCQGERRLTEFELDWLEGYENSKPVRVGNAASGQFQLDVYGEVFDSLHQAEQAGIEWDPAAWRIQVALLEFLESHWTEPDDGVWEVRGPRRHFTHSKMMAWVAADRAVTAIEKCGREGDVERWKKLRDSIHAEVCERGYDSKRKAFVQHFGSKELDASLLMMPLVGFLPASDERVRNTIETIERELKMDGFILRYKKSKVDGLPGKEGAFLPCSFWMADCLRLIGRGEDARELFERLLALRNDLGLLAEEYDPIAKRQLGNFPQAFTHVALVNTARNLSCESGHVVRR